MYPGIEQKEPRPAIPPVAASRRVNRRTQRALRSLGSGGGIQLRGMGGGSCCTQRAGRYPPPGPRIRWSSLLVLFVWMVVALDPDLPGRADFFLPDRDDLLETVDPISGGFEDARVAGCGGARGEHGRRPWLETTYPLNAGTPPPTRPAPTAPL